MKDSGIEIINIFQNEDDEKKSEIVTQKMQKIINSRINSPNRDDNKYSTPLKSHTE